jgi:hypothetical protein
MMTDPLGGWADQGTPHNVLVAMTKIEPLLAEVGELLAIATAKLRSATVEEMPALIDDANEAARLILACCMASHPAGYLSTQEAAMLRAELIRLGEALESQIARIIDSRLAQLVGGATSPTRH